MVMKKSGDSKLQDAADARADDASSAPDITSVYEQVQDAAERAKASGAAPERVAELEANLARLLNIVEDLSSKVSKQATVVTAQQAAQIVKPNPLSGAICSSCGQQLSVCNGAHARMNVMPNSPENMQFFQGVIWNGVRYFGPCLVPLMCAHDIVATVRNWEYGERLLTFGRSKVMDQTKRGQHPGLVWDKNPPVI